MKVLASVLVIIPYLSTPVCHDLIVARLHVSGLLQHSLGARSNSVV